MKQIKTAGFETRAGMEDIKYDFAAGQAKARAMSDAELHHALKDLNEVIGIQDKANQEGSMNTPKLGYYMDERHTLLQEVNRRRQGQTGQQPPISARSKGQSKAAQVQGGGEQWRAKELSDGFVLMKMSPRMNASDTGTANQWVPVAKIAVSHENRNLGKIIADAAIQALQSQGGSEALPDKNLSHLTENY